MKHVKNVFLVLAFALSAAAFSTSATAASNSPLLTNRAILRI
ncbi:TPA: PagK family vesicle-borne virulence factor [Salmonella enterica]|nr:hypothetical protein [Salmonella enterica]EBD3762804.1 hypothetical protein [Salmonella enterica]EBM0614513.1 hypothetical protein [Salmonella enterica]EGH8509784.1 hypothetical protein [Salmonella enterica]EGM2018903.1 hypothetical protein [Salmonella enterica]